MVKAKTAHTYTKTQHKTVCSKANCEMCPETCLDLKGGKKMLSVVAEEAISIRFGTVKCFIANTIFQRIDALMRNN